MQTNRLSNALRSLFFLAVLALCATCARNPVTGKKQLSFMSTKQEVAMGLESNPQILAEFGVYEDSVLQQFLDQKGQAMARVSHRPGLKWHFKLVDSPVVNAFALPGGYVYFTRGIMAHFNSEAQFAGVLGHEIGHVTARHGAESYTKGMLAQIGLIAGMIAVPQLAQFGDAASTGLQLLLLKNGRDNESQSDKLGILYSSRIGYDSKHMADFFQTLKRLSDKASGGRDIPTFLSTHPDPEDRYNKVHQMTADFQSKVKNRTFVENRDQYLSRIDGLIYGEDPRQGYVEGNVFYHPELKFDFPIPAGWKTQNSPAQFQMASADQKAIMFLSLSGQKTPQAAAQEVVTKYKLTARDQQAATVNGMPAFAILADQLPQQQQGQPQQQGQQQQPVTRVLVYAIQHDGNVYLILGASDQKDYDRFKPSFLATMKGFDKLSDPAKINVKPEVIRIRKTGLEATFAEVMKGFGMEQARLEELAILNGRKQADRMPSGTLIKIVEKKK